MNQEVARWLGIVLYNARARANVHWMRLEGANAMDGERFDAWTRRRFGLAAGGAAASMLGLLGLDDAEAKKKKNKKKNKNKKNKNKKQCRKLGQTCDQTQKNKKCCNQNQLCAQVQGLGSGNFCCKQRGSGCSVNTDCCGSDKCTNGSCVAP